MENNNEQNYPKSYLIIADQITFRGNKLTAINMWDQFTALALPANFNFDMAFLCGPEWQEGEYEVKFKVQTDSSEIFDLGNIKVQIKDRTTVFNAIASNLNLVADKNSTKVRFWAEIDSEKVFEREYSLGQILSISQQQQGQLEQNQEESASV